MQIADAIIHAIKIGKLSPGDALPGSRQLATKLLVNRNTVTMALDVLSAEGWLVAQPRKGMFVAHMLPTFKARKAIAKQRVEQPQLIKPHIFFDDGLPDTRIAPMDALGAAYRQIFSRKGRWQMMGYSDAAGEEEFRIGIAQMLNYNRGMHLHPDQVFITRGSQMATFLAAHCLLVPGDLVAVENPGYKAAWEAFEHAGATLLPIRVDEDGIVVEELKAMLAQKRRIKAIYVTPHHQFPTTVTLSLARRLELVELSNRYGFTIIEDDYDNEFHFGQRPIFPVSSSEQLENYVYIGTMSKIIAPALRIGYFAASPAIVAKAKALRRIIDVQGDNMMTQAVLQLIDEGYLKRHLRKATTHYRTKRDVFEELIKTYLSDKVTCKKPQGGLAFWLIPNTAQDLDLLEKKLLKKGVAIVSPKNFGVGDTAFGLRLGYASLDNAQLEQGIAIMAEMLLG
ncbi:MocR-like pyridoxine biosynthesis transcription factor PdxR [Sphingobacterium griseoflavum]|nr:PLP-dependent aminotransferase family protein [Sphingobacterium griseoflavum]